jgi:hypothetical protein
MGQSDYPPGWSWSSRKWDRKPGLAGLRDLADGEDWLRSGAVDWLRSGVVDWLRSGVVDWLRSGVVDWLRSGVVDWLRSGVMDWLRSGVVDWLRFRVHEMVLGASEGAAVGWP